MPSIEEDLLKTCAKVMPNVKIEIIYGQKGEMVIPAYNLAVKEHGGGIWVVCRFFASDFGEIGEMKIQTLRKLSCESSNNSKEVVRLVLHAILDSMLENA